MERVGLLQRDASGRISFHFDYTTFPEIQRLEKRDLCDVKRAQGRSYANAHGAKFKH